MLLKTKNFVPTYCTNSIYDISVEWLKKNKYKIVFCDLDNTLASSSKVLPTQKTKDWIKKIVDKNIKFVVLSNNNYDRVSTYCKNLNVDFFWSSLKPFNLVWKKIKKKYEFENENALMIGDQFLTDIWFANRNHISSVLIYSKESKSKNFFIASIENKLLTKLKKSKTYKEKRIK